MNVTDSNHITPTDSIVISTGDEHLTYQTSSCSVLYVIDDSEDKDELDETEHNPPIKKVRYRGRINNAIHSPPGGWGFFRG